MTSMEEETQMQEDMLVEEVPETTPLEQHASKGEAKEINPKTSKWLWFVVVILLVLASFGVAFYIMQQNAELESEIESNFFPESERQTNKAIKEIGTTLKEVKDDSAKAGEEDLFTLPQEFSNGHGFILDYPKGFHVASNLGEKGWELWIDPRYINLAPRGGDPALMFFRNHEVIGYETNATIEEVLEGEREKFQNLEETTFSSKGDLLVYKLVGEREAFGNFIPATAYYFQVSADENGFAHTYTVDVELWTEEQKALYAEDLETMLMSLRDEHEEGTQEVEI